MTDATLTDVLGSPPLGYRVRSIFRIVGVR